MLVVICSVVLYMHGDKKEAEKDAADGRIRTSVIL